MNKSYVLLFCLGLSGVVYASPTISDLKVTPIEPIGLAIDYKVSGAVESDLGKMMQVSMSVGDVVYVANVEKSVLGAIECVNGLHRVYWNVAKDDVTLGKTNLNLTVKYVLPVYCVIDLSKGVSAGSYPVAYLDSPPSGGFNTTEYKTKKIVLKRVESGTFIMGDSSVSYNQPHTVTLSRPFYMGLFEVTQKQWELVMGTTPCSGSTHGRGDSYPVYYIAYNDIRGSSEGAKWPTTNSVDVTSFMGRLRAKTGIDFDLPTEAQWEYTCRAGTRTSFSYGDSANGDYMWYGEDYTYGSTHEVGMKRENPWGFYDMHGNVWEWCLDWWSNSLSDGIDPVGPSSGSFRILRGGTWQGGGSDCTSSYRVSGPAARSIYENHFNTKGFRLAWTIP